MKIQTVTIEELRNKINSHISTYLERDVMTPLFRILINFEEPEPTSEDNLWTSVHFDYTVEGHRSLPKNLIPEGW